MLKTESGHDSDTLLKISVLQDAIFNSVAFSCIATNEKGVIQLFNVGAERMLGYAAADVVNQLTHATLSDAQELLDRAVALSLEFKTPIAPGFDALVYKAARGIEDIYEMTKVRKDGSRFPAIVSVTALRDAQKSIIGYLMIGTDNTARKQVEATQADQRQGSQYARSLIEASLDPLVTISADGKITDVNEATIAVTGVTRAGLIGTDFSNYFTEAEKAREGYQQVFAEGFVTDYPLTIRHQNGRLTDVLYNASVYKDMRGNVLGVFAAARDVTDQKQASQYARSLIEASLDPLVTISADGKITDVNETAIKVTGVPRSELVGTEFASYFTEPDKAREGYEEVFSKGFVTDYPLTIRHTEGKFTDVLYNASVFKDVDGKVLGVFAAARDVTASKRAERTLQALIETAPDAMIMVNQQGTIMLVNGQTERSFDYARSDLLGKPIEMLVPERFRSLHPGHRASFFKAPRLRPMGLGLDLWGLRRNGSEFPIELSLSPIETEAGTHVTATIRDVTAQKQAGHYVRSLIEASLDPLVTISADGKITDVNEATIAVTGVTRAGLIGTDFSNYFTEAEKAREGYQQVFAEGFVTDYPLTIRHQNGRLIDVLYNASVYKDMRGNVLGVFAAARDVTEQKRFERTLEEKNIELEHASRMKSEFLATMSHELRTPLNAIIGFSEALKDGLVGSMSDMQQEYIGDIFSSGQHLLSLINDILDLSKVEAGMMELELEAVDLKSLLSNSLSIVREKAAAHRIGLQLETDEDLGLPRLDMRKTKQIVYNLLSNAVKFSANGGGVTLRARRVPRKVVGTLPGIWPMHSFLLADNEYKEFLEISVSDRGIGISPENMVKLFHAFSQVDSSLARKFEGTGLGLAMVRQLAELQGGSVAVASREGEGSTFAVWLPLRTSAITAGDLSPSVAVAAVRAVPAVAGLKERFALVVEDDTLAADSPRLLLEAEGFIVLHAASAEAALQLAAKQTLDLITLDLQLPRFDGWAFLLQLRESSTLADVPVVLMTGLANSDMTLTRGASAVLQKPISSAQLHTSLTNLGLQPAQEHTNIVLAVDDDALALDLIAGLLPSPAYAVVRAHGGREAIILTHRLRPDLILLDLIMPDVSGFDVVEALQRHTETASIPILVLTAKQITAQDRSALSGHADNVIRIVEKAGFNRGRFMAEVKRALSLN